VFTLNFNLAPDIQQNSKISNVANEIGAVSAVSSAGVGAATNLGKVRALLNHITCPNTMWRSSKKDDIEFIQFYKERMKELEDEERQEKAEIRQRNKDLSQFRMYQADVKKKTAEEEFIKDQEEAYKTKFMLNQEQDDFLKYAEGWIQEYQREGKDITPLILELKNYRKNINTF
jgi:hypothetical protein